MAVKVHQLRIATRKSPLALWQAEFVKQKLKYFYPELDIELLGLTTEGDRHIASTLSKAGGKSLFVKELEQALLDGRADIAVHSMKDVPMDFPQGLILAAICERQDPRDVFVSNSYQSLDLLPHGAVIGTSSLRRQCQLLALRPDLKVLPLRGNVNTRLRKLDDGEFDAIVLAAAGLLRLNIGERISSYLALDQCLPAAGQGALGIECREADKDIYQLVSVLNDDASSICVMAERAMSKRLGSGCQVPVAGYAVLQNDQLTLRGMVGKPDGSLLLSVVKTAAKNSAEQLGIQVADSLLEQGAAAILQEINNC